MAKTKKNLSLELLVIQKGLKRANELGFDFSSYVTYLINLDTKNLSNKENEGIVVAEKSEKKEPNEINFEVADNETLNEVDNILNGNI